MMADYGRVSQVVVESVIDVADSGRVSAVMVEMLVETTVATAVVPDIAGVPDVANTFDGSASAAAGAYRWRLTARPAGSATPLVAAPVQLPDNQATTPIDMTSNAALFHCLTTQDSSGNANHASLSSITTGVEAGKVHATGWGFTTAGAKATLTNAISFAGEYTFGYWFKNLKADGEWRNAGGDTSLNQMPILVHYSNNQLGAHIGGTFYALDTLYTMPAASFIGWHRMDVVATAVDVRYYVDGALVGAITGHKVTSDLKYIGNNPGGWQQRFADVLDDVMVLTRAMTAREIFDLYTLSSGDYGGNGSTYAITPDVVGTYTAELKVLALDGFTVNTDTADDVVTLPVGGIRLQGRGFRPALHGGSLQGTGIQPTC